MISPLSEKLQMGNISSKLYMNEYVRIHLIMDSLRCARVFILLLLVVVLLLLCTVTRVAKSAINELY